MQVLNHLNICTSSSGDSGGDAVVVCGVQRAARAVDGHRVVILPHYAADYTDEDFPVLLPQQAVDERVAGGLGVRQTFGSHAPVPGDVHIGQQLHQPAGGRSRRRSGRQFTWLEEKSRPGRHIMMHHINGVQHMRTKIWSAHRNIANSDAGSQIQNNVIGLHKYKLFSHD